MVAVSVPLRGRGFESVCTRNSVRRFHVSVPLRGRGFESGGWGVSKCIVRSFRPLTGKRFWKKRVKSIVSEWEFKEFPSPYGEEVLKEVARFLALCFSSFRPLTGKRFWKLLLIAVSVPKTVPCFRPLTGKRFWKISRCKGWRFNRGVSVPLRGRGFERVSRRS